MLSQKKFKKGIDKLKNSCYNKYVKRIEQRKELIQ